MANALFCSRRRRSLTLSGLCCLSGFTGVATGCSSTPNWFGAGEGGLVDWEIDRRNTEADTGELAASIKVIVRKRLNRILAVLPQDKRSKLGEVEIDVMQAPKGLFVFASGFDFHEVPPAPLIQTSSETVAGLHKVAMAQSVGTLVDKDGAWLYRYLLYVRALPDGDAIVDPLRASGVYQGGNPPVLAIERSKFETVWNNAQWMADSMLRFLIAHEVAHLVTPRKPQGILESEEKYTKRVRADEARADSEGLKLLAAIEAMEAGAEKQVPLYLLGAPMVFLQWIMTMQGARRSLRPRTHPLDHVRALSAVRQIGLMLADLPLTSVERKSIPNTNAKAIAEIEAIEKRGVEAYFADLDKEARGVTLASLRFVPTK
jgi:hypothetical protein